MQLETINILLKHPLTKGHKLKTFSRFIKREILKKISNKPIIYDFLGDIKLSVEKSMPSAELQVYTGLYDFCEMSFVLHFLRENDLFVDVGANVGVYSLLASGYNKSNSMAIEPIPQTFEYFKNNIRLNRLDSLIEALNIGIGSEKGELFFTRQLDAVNHVLREEDKDVDTLKVPVDTIDNLMVNRNPNVLKVDVEGFETEVIKGSLDTLKNQSLKAIIIELNGLADKYQNDENKIHQVIVESGFKPCKYDPFSRELTELENYKMDDSNTIYIRDSDFVNKRLQSARPFEILDYKI